MEQTYKFHTYINCVKYRDIYRIVIFFQVIGDSSFFLVIHTPSCYTGQMLAASWGKPEVHCHVIVKNHSTCRLTVSV